MGIYRQKRSGIQTGQGELRHKSAETCRDHHRGMGNRIALAASCFAAIVNVILAMAWPNWATVHGAVILCGLSVTFYFVPWLEEWDDAPQSKFERQIPDVPISQAEQHVEQRRAA